MTVEVLCAGNTPGEMARKRQEYLAAGVRLVWLVDPEARTVEVYTDPDQSTVRHEADTLEGAQYCPGLRYRYASCLPSLTAREITNWLCAGA